MPRRETDAQLRRRARRAGWIDTYTDGLGQPRITPIEALRLLVNAIDDARLPARARERSSTTATPLCIPVSRTRRLALFLPLYALRSDSVTGIGTYTDLRALVDWAKPFDNALIGTLPLFPSFYDKPFDPSPYAPVSRLFWNELYIDLAAAPEFEAPAVRGLRAAPAWRRKAALSKRAPDVDYRVAWEVQRSALSEMARAAMRRPDRWREIVRLAGPDAGVYAGFRAADSPSDAPLYIYAQALANSQMAAIARRGTNTSPLYLDLPLGVHPHGFDARRYTHHFLRGISAGAPPDRLNASGQLWGFPPMNPRASSADGHAHFRAILRRMFAVAGVLRIDHVMWLHRIYCVPAGFDGTAGAYLRFPARELYDVLVSEATRANAVVVGEDLGTVPPEVRHTMRRRGLLRMHVGQFRLDPDPSAPIAPADPGMLTSLNTHDTPAFAGFWNARDITLRQRLGLTAPALARRERAARTRLRSAATRQLIRLGLSAGTARQAALSLMRVHAGGPASIQLINLEDLWGEARPQNIPGTLSEYPNWRGRARYPLSQLVSKSSLTAALKDLAFQRSMAMSPRAWTAVT